MLELTIQQLQERIKDSRLRDILAEELRDLLSRKPDGVRTDEYITAAAVVILKELKQELIRNNDTIVRDTLNKPGPAPLDCETIINGLLIGMHHDLLESNLQMVQALGSAIAERDYGTSEHNLRVTIYAVKLAEEAALSKPQIQSLMKGSFLHDVGKIGITDNTLLKPSSLSEQEYEDVKQHVLFGKRIIENVRWLEDAVDIILYHHENWDGSGYPEGLKGRQIPLLARVFSLADVFDALTSDRPYKPPMLYEETIRTITVDEAERFDPDLLGKFESISKQLYEQFLPMSVRRLENELLKMVNQYFHFSPTVDDLRASLGSSERRKSSR